MTLIQTRETSQAPRPPTTEPEQREQALSRFVRRHRFATYVVGTLSISWTGVVVAAAAQGFDFRNRSLIPVLLAMVPGPMISALVVTALADGKRGLRDLWMRLTRWRVGVRWYAFALIVPAVVLGVLVTLGWFVDDAYVPSWNVGFILIGTVAGVFEEIGWTGVATPELLRRHRPLAAGLLLGVVWSVWHVLADGITNEPSWWSSLWFPKFATAFLVGLIAWRVVMTYVYSHTKSILVGILLHGFYTGSLGAFKPDTTDAQYVIWNGAMAAVLCIFAAVLTIRKRKETA